MINFFKIFFLLNIYIFELWFNCKNINFFLIQKKNYYLHLIKNLIKFKLNNILIIYNLNDFLASRTLLTPSLEIYYPLKSSILSITIRITGVFAICCLILILYCLMS